LCGKPKLRAFLERELKGVAAKLGSLKGVGRDGTLVLVSEDLTKIKSVKDVAPTFQSAIENWTEIEPQLIKINRRLNSETISDSLPYDPNVMVDPLMYQGGSDNFLGATDPIHIKDESWGGRF